jgi:hypothetical protein
MTKFIIGRVEIDQFPQEKAASADRSLVAP